MSGAILASVEEPASLRDYFDGWARYIRDNPAQRNGQAAFNYLFDWDRNAAEEIWGTETDPFFVDERLPKFFEWLINRQLKAMEAYYRNNVSEDSK
jgi:hypothetical protein